jgi:hypothetical protein
LQIASHGFLVSPATHMITRFASYVNKACKFLPGRRAPLRGFPRQCSRSSLPPETV